jgi:ATP-binding cassette subfamily F protein 3
MSLIQVNNLYKSFSGEMLFNNISFNINENDKIGIIGHNGAGKSTLIKMILGLEELDVDPATNVAGSIIKAKNITLGYLSQHSDLNEEFNIFEELISFHNLHQTYSTIFDINKKLENGEYSDELMEKLSDAITLYQEKNGYAIEANIKKILDGLSLEEKFWHNKIKTLSGGQKTRVMLAKILIQEPDLLILDEPTNHLDLNAIEWLEEYLKSYSKSFMLISHDIYFLDNVVAKIFEIDGKKLNTYKGNYSDYKIQKEVYLSGALKAFEKEQDRIKQLEAFVLKYKAGQKSKQAMGRQKQLNNIDRLDNPIVVNKNMRLSLNYEYKSGKEVLLVDKLKKSFGDNLLFTNLTMQILCGDRIGIIGDNGVGKSTFLKILMNEESYDEGSIKFGEKLKISYFSQEHKDLNLNNTILDEIINNFPLSESEARNLCGQIKFSKDDVFKKIKSLSGGERARVAFLKLILNKPNFLILDEPTNHLDIQSKEILIEALEDYDGSILAVSHDRNFLDNIVNKLYIIKQNKVDIFNGNYSEYKAYLLENQPVKTSNNKNNDKNKLNTSIEAPKKINVEAELKKLAEKEAKLLKEYEVAGKENNLELLIKIQAQLDEIEAKLADLMG